LLDDLLGGNDHCVFFFGDDRGRDGFNGGGGFDGDDVIEGTANVDVVDLRDLDLWGLGDRKGGSVGDCSVDFGFDDNGLDRWSGLE
jgi:hypothetical protein